MTELCIAQKHIYENEPEPEPEPEHELTEEYLSSFFNGIYNISVTQMISYNGVKIAPSNPFKFWVKDSFEIATIMNGMPHGNNNRVVVVLVLERLYDSLKPYVECSPSLEKLEYLTGDNIEGIIYNSRAKYCLDNNFTRQPIISYNYNGCPDRINVNISCKENIVMLVYKVQPYYTLPICKQLHMLNM